MAKRLIETTIGPCGTVKTYYDSDWQEYQCIRQRPGGTVEDTYHADSKRDALSTALHMAHGKEMAQHIQANVAQQQDDHLGDD